MEPTPDHRLAPTLDNRPAVLLTPAEADDLLRFPRGRSTRLARAGQLPHWKLPDGSVRFPVDLLQRLAMTKTAGEADGEHFPRLTEGGAE